MKAALEKRSLALGAVLLALVACYELKSIETVLWKAPMWTGTGTAVANGPKYSVGLAGQDVYYFRPGDEFMLDDPFYSWFEGPYELTSMAQTNQTGLHEQAFYHGNLAGRTDNLRLLRVHRIYNANQWVEPGRTTIWVDERPYDIVQICDMAAVTRDNEWNNPYDENSHLYMSVRACPEKDDACVGAVIEATFDREVEHWSVDLADGEFQVAVRNAKGGLFADECMPISATSWGDHKGQYLAVAEPTRGSVSIFDPFRLWDGGIGMGQFPADGRFIKDVVIEGSRKGDYDYPFLAILWAGSKGVTIEHHLLEDGTFLDAPDSFLSEAVDTDIAFIEARGVGLWPNELYTYGSRVDQRNYTR